MEPINTFADDGVLRVIVTGPFDMSLGFDLWYIWQLEHGRYHTYIFDLGRVEELHDSGLAWLMMFQRWATKTKISVRLINCRSDVWERCIKAGLEMGSVAPHLSIHAVSSHTVYLAHKLRRTNHEIQLFPRRQVYSNLRPLWLYLPR